MPLGAAVSRHYGVDDADEMVVLSGTYNAMRGHGHLQRTLRHNALSAPQPYLQMASGRIADPTSQPCDLIH